MRVSTIAGAAMAGVALASAGIAATAKEPTRIFTPVSGWTVNYDDDSCRLTRPFASDGEKAGLVLEQFEPGSGFRLLAATPTFKDYISRPVRIAFGPTGHAVDIDSVMDLSLGDYGPAVTAAMDLVSPPQDGPAASPQTPPPEPSAAEENAVTWLDIQRRSRAPVRFATGPMHGAMAALRKCSDELITHWGIDVAAHQTLSRPATPKSRPASWLTSDDYPSDLLQKGAQGLIMFRLMIDEAGKVTSCHIQKSTRPVGFDTAVCAALSRRARFEPALDAGGRPIKSYWRSSARFQVS